MIDSAVAENETASTVDLRAAINPHAGQTSYRIEYGTSVAYGMSIPVPDGTLAAGLSDQSIVEHVSGLASNTTYHWRVVAHNIAGTATGADHTFVYDTVSAGLPDGRVYEMVSPPDKNGAQLGNGLFVLFPDLSSDGSRVIMISIQCFAGAGSCTAQRRNTEGEPFLFSRTGDGWAETPLAPQATQFNQDGVEKVSAESGMALFVAPTPPMGEDDFYVRRTDGSFADVGPIAPPAVGAALLASGNMGATSDFSHVVYTLGVVAPQWPFATPGVESLYEYTGLGNAQPALVGVSGGRGSTDADQRLRHALCRR